MATGNDIFQITGFELSEEILTAKIAVNVSSELFKGHFPGRPVVPGACIVQLVKDVLEEALGDNLRLKKADQIKFSKMIIPKDDQALQLTISYKTVEEGLISVNAKLSEEEIVCFKFQGLFSSL